MTQSALSSGFRHPDHPTCKTFGARPYQMALVLQSTPKHFIQCRLCAVVRLPFFTIRIAKARIALASRFADWRAAAGTQLHKGQEDCKMSGCRLSGSRP